jgi:hypothetical protein
MLESLREGCKEICFISNQLYDPRQAQDTKEGIAYLRCLLRKLELWKASIASPYMPSKPLKQYLADKSMLQKFNDTRAKELDIQA